MKKHLIVVCLLGMYCYAFAQQKARVDSLKKVLATKLSHKQRVDTYNQLARNLQKSDTTQAALYYTKAVRLATQHAYAKGLANAHYLKGWAHLAKQRYTQAEILMNKALQVARKAQNKASEMKAYQGLAAVYFYKESPKEAEAYCQQIIALAQELKKPQVILSTRFNMALLYDQLKIYDKALSYYTQCLKLSQQLKDTQTTMEVYACLAEMYQTKSDYDKALESYQKALAMQQKSRDSMGVANTYNNVGMVYSSKGNYKQAFAMYFKALAIQEKLKPTRDNKERLANTINNIGVLYYEQKDYPKAKEYYERNLKISLENKNEESIATAYNNLALVFEHTHQYPQAEAYYKKCIQLGKKIDYQQILGWAYNGMAIIRQKAGQYAKAEKWVNQAIDIRKKLGMSEDLTQSYNTLGKNYLLQKQYNKAMTYYQKAADIGKKIGNLLNYKDALKGLSICLEAVGKPARALANYRLYHQISDSLINTENIRKIAYLAATIDFKKEKTALKLSRQKERAVFAKDTRQRKYTQRITYMSLGVALMLVVVLWLFYFSKQKSNRALTLLNKQISDANERIIQETNARRDTEKEKLQSEVKLKNQQLASQTLHMLQKNQILNDLKTLVGEVRKQKDLNDAKAKFSRLANLIDHGINLDKDWEGFQRIFEQLHPEFYANLKNSYPVLTSNDLHLCALLKLNLSSREISDLLGIAQESLKVKRYRLRQKMGLDSDKNLNEFILTFDAI
ncbi:tetratricopeptide repeat protein [Microscilla marina]|nr:tetratricopeptide repeat protein [Microscilla marina]